MASGQEERICEMIVLDANILIRAILGRKVRTEDTDFFGTGVAIWTTNRIEIFLNALLKPDNS